MLLLFGSSSIAYFAPENSPNARTHKLEFVGQLHSVSEYGDLATSEMYLLRLPGHTLQPLDREDRFFGNLNLSTGRASSCKGLWLLSPTVTQFRLAVTRHELRVRWVGFCVRVRV